MPDQPIQFLLDQLATNEQDRERFNLVNQDIDLFIAPNGDVLFEVAFQDHYGTFFDQVGIIQQAIIRTCLSRVNGQVVLGVFKKTRAVKSYDGKILKYQEYSEPLYYSFSDPIYNGKPLDESIQALHEKMLELVPEYVEFLKNNNK